MKLKLLLFLSFCFISKLNSQTKEWYNYKLDSIISLDMPYDVYEVDTIIDYNKIYQIYSEEKSARFIAQKMYVGKQYSNIESLKLPINKKSLDLFYNEIINTLEVMIDGNFDYKKRIENYSIKGYEIGFSDNQGLNIHQIRLYYLNKYVYSFSYVDEKGIDKKDKDIFFDSISFNKELELLQYPKKSLSKKLLIGLLILLFISFAYRYKS